MPPSAPTPSSHGTPAVTNGPSATTSPNTAPTSSTPSLSVCASSMPPPGVPPPSILRTNTLKTVPSVSFAPLPQIDEDKPRKRTGGVPLGVATQSRMLRAHRLMQAASGDTGGGGGFIASMGGMVGGALGGDFGGGGDADLRLAQALQELARREQAAKAKASASAQVERAGTVEGAAAGSPATRKPQAGVGVGADLRARKDEKGTTEKTLVAPGRKVESKEKALRREQKAETENRKSGSIVSKLASLGLGAKSRTPSRTRLHAK